MAFILLHSFDEMCLIFPFHRYSNVRCLQYFWMTFLESFASCIMCVAILRYNTCSPSLTLMTNYNSAVRRIAALVSKANNDQIIPRIDHRGRIVTEQHLFLTNHEKRRRIVNAYFRRLKSQIRTSNSERKKKSAVLYKAMRWVI